MKKLILTAAVALFAFTANAQEENNESTVGFAKGDVFVTGSVGFASTSQDEDKSNGFTIAPQAGYFVTENIAAGVKLGYTSAKAESNGTDTSDLAEFSAGVFGRYYFTPASQFSLYGQLGLDYSTAEDKLADAKVNGFNVGLGAGLNYFVSNNFSIEAGIAVLGYDTKKADASGAEAKNTFSIGGDWTAVSFGVNYKF